MLIVSRVQLVSAIFSVLVPLWIAVDAMAFDPAIWMAIAPVRAVAALVFLFLAWPTEIHNPRLMAPLMLGVMLMVPPAFHLLTTPIIDSVEPSGFAAVVCESYRYLPFTVVAGLSIFPLTAIEVGAGAALVFAAMVLARQLDHAFDWQALIGPAWLLTLISGTAMVSGMCQLHYMMALVRRVTFDALTGVLTRRAGADLLDTQFRLSVMHGRPLSLAFLDLDRFKQINDTFGHEAGDAVLQSLAERVSAVLRQGDALVRWGGEEFLMILGATDKNGARLVITRLGRHGFGQRPDGSPVTASIGVAERLVDALQDWRGLVELADKRMYEAKVGGRNGAVFGPDDVITTLVRPAGADATADRKSPLPLP